MFAPLPFRRLLIVRGFIVFGLLFVSSSSILVAEEQESPKEKPEAAGVDYFEKHIRPVLVERCYQCHSAAAQSEGKLKGGLLLDSRQGLLTGGDTGPALVPHKPAESLIVQSLRYDEDSYQMPPSGKLPQQVVAVFEKWIGMGAPDPRDGTAPVAQKSIDWDAARQFWSLQPPQRHPLPAVQQTAWPQRPIDYFLLAKIEDARLQVAPPADRLTLLRRASFDLRGLPPTPDEQAEFLADESPDAYARLIERLLESPHYGERWGRHWLDVARYAEDNTNMGPHNGPYEHAWRYRDWVVQALNDDVPYDEFIVRQLATDFMPETGPADHAALGFQGLAPSYHKEVALAKVVLENRYADEWEDRVDAIGRGLLGLTLACARCHDHKYDPVTVEDYYALAGIFASCRQTTRPIIPADEIQKTQPARDRAAALEKEIATGEKLLKDLPAEIAKLEKQLKEHAAKPAEKKPGEKKPDEEQAENTEEPSKKSDKKPEVKPFDPAEAQERIATAKQQIEETKPKVEQAKNELAELKKTPGFEIPVANALTEEQVRVEEINKDRMKIVYYADKPRDLNIFIRGDAGRLGTLVPRRFLAVLNPLVTSRSSDAVTPFQQGSGRLELAQAIANPNNPLTARVIVNRVWMHHFGVGIVDTPSNFGVTGNPPSHPELLDDLAVRFMENGWSLKWLHREIMLSAAYQQSSVSANSPQQQAADSDNRLLSHFNRHRLDAEAFRDAVLAVSGELDRKLGGPSGDADDAKFRRRTLYAIVSRHKLSDTLQTFDFPDPAIHCSKRALTTTPLQQMFVLNSPFMQDQAAALAARVRQDKKSLAEQITLLYQLLFGRSPHADELALAQEFLPADADKPEQVSEKWKRYAHALLSSNEFMYVD